MAEAGCRVCLMVLCGLPASGKTSLTKLLAGTSTFTAGTGNSTAGTSNSKGLPSFIIIEYDKLLPVDVERHLIEEETTTGANSLWKKYRDEIYQCVDTFMCQLSKGMFTSISLVQKPNDVTGGLWNSFQEHVNKQQHHGQSVSGDVCVVVDDNMYYHSMRYRYYQLARKYTLGFCQVYLECKVPDALERNSQRDFPQSVSDNVITTMAQKFEVPDTVNNVWEKLSLTSFLSEINMPDIYKLIQQALDTPVQPVDEPDEESLNQSREICSANFLHQSDKILRQLVSQEMASAKKRKLQKLEMQDFSRGIQARKKLILHGLKSGQISIPSSVNVLVTDAAKDPDSMVYDFVKSLFFFIMKI